MKSLESFRILMTGCLDLTTLQMSLDIMANCQIKYEYQYYSLFWTSPWYFIIEGGEASGYTHDFTYISIENMKYIFIPVNLK